MGRSRSSAVCTWRWVPTTALTRPSRCQPMACDSDVASACMSTTMIGVSARSRSSSSSALRKGQSSCGRNTRPIRLSTATLCGPALITIEPGPGSTRGVVGRAQEQVLLADVLDDLLLVPDVVAGGHHVHALLEEGPRDQRRDPEARGRVLHVDHRQVGLVLLLELGQQHLDRAPARLAEDVAHADDGERLGHLATSTARVSRITTTLMWPGYCISASMRLEMSLASWWASRSEICSALVMIRSSRPAWIA